MWDLVILTAGNDRQRDCFEKQLKIIPDRCLYSKSFKVIADVADGCRIGSGGATIQIIRHLLEVFPNEEIVSKKILLCHSGGLSQRMPHQSAFGKVFGFLGNGKTILETKLEIYRKHLVNNLPPGLMITASDVVEDMSMMIDCRSSTADFILFSHISTPQVGSQHGVFIVDEFSKLKCVLQKPSADEMKQMNALRPDRKVLTDSCFQMTWQICQRLARQTELQNIDEELCCYGDFMRPMGYSPKLDYIDDGCKLGKYRRILAGIFANCDIKMINLGPKSFFHFGTFHEFLAHNSIASQFRSRFPSDTFQLSIHSEKFADPPAHSRYFVEFSRIFGCVSTLHNTIISGVELLEEPRNGAVFPDDVVIFTLAIREKEYVTIIMGIDQDLKLQNEKVFWNSRPTSIRNCSLWTARLFRAADSRIESFRNTLDEWNNGLKEGPENERISIDEAIQMHNIARDLEWRKRN